MGELSFHPSLASDTQHSIDKTSPNNILLIHGLEGIPYTMWPLGWRFQHIGWNVIQYRYQSHKITFQKAKELLHQLLSEYPTEKQPTYAIGFSMGGLVLSQLLEDSPSIQRAILLGSPLLASQAAERMLSVPFSRRLLGPSLEILAEDRKYSLPKNTEIAAIAGYGPIYGSWNPLLDGENDGIVRVEEALPPSISQQTKVPAPHIGLVLKSQPFSLMLEFLQNGRFMNNEYE